MALYNGDVKSNVATSNVAIVGGPARIKGISFVAGASNGSIVLKDGGASGTTTINIATPANGYDNFPLPGDGVLFATNVFANLTNITSLTVFYG